MCPISHNRSPHPRTFVSSPIFFKKLISSSVQAGVQFRKIKKVRLRPLGLTHEIMSTSIQKVQSPRVPDNRVVFEQCISASIAFSSITGNAKYYCRLIQARMQLLLELHYCSQIQILTSTTTRNRSYPLLRQYVDNHLGLHQVWLDIVIMV